MALSTSERESPRTLPPRSNRLVNLPLWLSVLIGLTTSLGVALSGLLVVVTVTRPEPVPPPAREGFTAYGTLDVYDEGRRLESNRSCQIRGRYSAIRANAPVTVSSVNPPKLLATGRLIGGSGVGTACHFTWAVTDVPWGRGPYDIAFAGSEPFRVTEAELSQAVEWSLGTPCATACSN